MNYIYRVAYLAKDGGTFHGLSFCDESICRRNAADTV